MSSSFRQQQACGATRKARGASLRAFVSAIVAGLTTLHLAPASTAAAGDMAALSGDGLMHTRSAYPVEETAKRIRGDIEAKGIMFMAEIDQSELGKGANIAVKPSRLLIFGNPPLGLLFLTSKPDSGMDWPVRMLVREGENGKAIVVYQDWFWVAARYGIADREKEFAKATEVVASIVSSVADCANLADCTE